MSMLLWPLTAGCQGAQTVPFRSISQFPVNKGYGEYFWGTERSSWFQHEWSPDIKRFLLRGNLLNLKGDTDDGEGQEKAVEEVNEGKVEKVVEPEHGDRGEVGLGDPQHGQANDAAHQEGEEGPVVE